MSSDNKNLARRLRSNKPDFLTVGECLAALLERPEYAHLRAQLEDHPTGRAA